MTGSAAMVEIHRSFRMGRGDELLNSFMWRLLPETKQNRENRKIKNA
jgi:hypothetical protein